MWFEASVWVRTEKGTRIRSLTRASAPVVLKRIRAKFWLKGPTGPRPAPRRTRPAVACRQVLTWSRKHSRAQFWLRGVQGTQALNVHEIAKLPWTMARSSKQMSKVRNFPLHRVPRVLLGRSPLHHRCQYSGKWEGVLLELQEPFS